MKTFAPGTAEHALFHRLWSNAVGSPTYVKEEWKTLEKFIAALAGVADGVARSSASGSVTREQVERLCVRLRHQADVHRRARDEARGVDAHVVDHHDIIACTLDEVQALIGVTILEDK